MSLRYGTDPSPCLDEDYISTDLSLIKFDHQTLSYGFGLDAGLEVKCVHDTTKKFYSNRIPTKASPYLYHIVCYYLCREIRY